ncbi:MAG: Rrf2 family transcriptional regulator [Flavobacteriaceae bacterium]|nr:Rrf2 family transcriptional regulator [Flavobacteriaceae bacterium]
MFSKACEYAIRATLHIAAHASIENKISIKEIASAIDSPVAFTAKILQQLVKNNIVESTKGPSGGFFVLEETIHKTHLGDIVEAIDGDAIFRGCGLGLASCDATCPCPVHNQFLTIRNDLSTMLQGTTLADLMDGLHKGETFLKRVS